MSDTDTEIIRMKCLSPWCVYHGLGGSIPFCSVCWHGVSDHSRARVLVAHRDALRIDRLINPWRQDPRGLMAAAQAMVEAGLARGRMTSAEAASRLTLAHDTVRRMGRFKTLPDTDRP